MDSDAYWKNREAGQKRKNLQDEKKYRKRIEEIYADMLDEIEKEIDSFYARYAGKEGITMAETKKRVSNRDIEVYGRKAKKYVEEKSFSNQANEKMRLYNATVKINRLEMLKAKIGLELVGGFEKLQKYFGEKLTERTMQEFEYQAGIFGERIQNSAKLADAIVNTSFQNAAYSDRVWMYQDLIMAELSTLLCTGFIQGQSAGNLTAQLRKRFGISQHNAERLMDTELRRVQTQAAKQSYERNGIEEYKFLTINARGPCGICKALDGKVFKVKDMQIGKNAPPMHPRCHCTMVPYWDEEEFEEWPDYLDKGGMTKEWKRLRTSEKSVEKSTDSGIMKSGARSGALTDKNDSLYERRDKHAESYYESVRNSKKDPIVKAISWNSGFSEAYISKVYDHVFINEYDLYGGKKRFEPDYDMAESFRRLREGKDIQKHDIILLKHEHLEYGLMDKLGILYEEAHDLTQRKYDYATALDYFKKENNL